MSYAQEERQRTRENGRYAKMRKCEVCGKPLGANYYSALSSAFTGKGLVLCRRCCAAWEAGEKQGTLGIGATT